MARLSDALPGITTGVKLLRSRRELPAMIVALTVGVGLTVAAYALLYAILLRALPYSEPERLVQIWEDSAEQGSNRTLLETDQASLATSPSSFQGIASYARTRDLLQREPGALPLEISGALVSANVFDVLGVRAAEGRTFEASDSRVTEDPPIVVSARLIRSGAVNARLGEQVHMRGASYRLVGIMSDAFWFPDRLTSYWVPLPPYTPAAQGGFAASSRSFSVVARLPSGATPGAAESQAKVRLFRPVVGAPRLIRVESWAALLAAPMRPALFVLQAASGVVLLLVCLNVSWLFLCRARRLRQAFVTMRALGAAPGQILVAHLVSAVFVAIVAVPCAVLTAWLLLRVGLTLDSGLLLRGAEPAVTWNVVNVAIIATVLASVASCLPSAVAITRWRGALTEASGTATRHRRLDHVTMTAQVGLVFAASAQAVLVALVLLSLSHTNVGLRKTDFIVISLMCRSDASTEPSVLLAGYKALLARLERRGIRAAAANIFPLINADSFRTFEASRSREHIRAAVRTRIVTPSYFPMTGLRPTGGRLLTDADVGAHHVVITDAFAASVLRTRVALGQRTGGRGEWTIIGVVPAARQFSVTEDAQPEAYVLFDDFLTLNPASAANELRRVQILAEVARGPALTQRIVRAEVKSLLPGVEIQAIVHATDLIARSVGVNRMIAAGSVLFASVALLLAAVGIHAMVSHNLEGRRREIGIRIALGATASRVVLEAVQPMAVVYGVGACIGVALLLLTLSAIRSVMPPPPGVGYPPLSTVVCVTASLLFAVVSAACLRPVTNAAATDPAKSLRAE